MNFARSAYKTEGDMEKNGFRQNLLSRIKKLGECYKTEGCDKREIFRMDKDNKWGHCYRAAPFVIFTDNMDNVIASRMSISAGDTFCSVSFSSA